MFANNDKMIEMLKVVCSHENKDMYSIVSGIVERELELKYKLYTSAFNEIEKQAVNDKHALVEKFRDLVFNASSEKIYGFISKMLNANNNVDSSVSDSNIFGVPLRDLYAVNLSELRRIEPCGDSSVNFHFNDENEIHYNGVYDQNSSRFKIILKNGRSRYHGWRFCNHSKILYGSNYISIDRDIIERNGGDDIIFAKNEHSKNICCVGKNIWMYDLKNKNSYYSFACPKKHSLPKMQDLKMIIYSIDGTQITTPITVRYRESLGSVILKHPEEDRIYAISKIKEYGLLNANIIIKLL